MDWFDLLAGQGTLKCLLQHHSSKASSLQGSAFFIVQFSHPYMTTGKTIALTRWTFVGKVMSLLFNKLSRLAMINRNIRHSITSIKWFYCIPDNFAWCLKHFQRPLANGSTSPAPQFKSINSLALSFLYSPILTSIHTGKTIALTRRALLAK